MVCPLRRLETHLARCPHVEGVVLRQPFRKFTRGAHLWWNIICSIVFHTLWALRNDPIHRSIDVPPTTVLIDHNVGLLKSHIKAIHCAAVDSDTDDDLIHELDFIASALQFTSQQVLPAHASAARDFRHLLAACRCFVSTPSPPNNPSGSTGEYVFFLDGGSRGNPGPGGAGAVVLRVDTLRSTFTLMWSAAMSLASPRTTNNQAEYLGLVTGLAAADRHRWRPLSVVGDSHLIIHQLQHYRPPKSPVLRRFYHSARRLADGLGVTRWSHHLRAFNKAADTAANIAMDTHRSIQTHHPTTRPESAGLEQLSAGDFLQWQASLLDAH